MSHTHHHPHDHSCSCGHNHDHSACTTAVPPATDHPQQIFLLHNLGCANCAAKMEAKIAALDRVEYASIAFPTKQLRLVTSIPAPALLPLLNEICQSIEAEVRVTPFRRKPKDSEQQQLEADRAAREQQQELGALGAGFTIMCSGLLLQHFGLIPNILFMTMMLFGYLLVGGNVLKTAIANIRHGQIFDENFLMSVATIGAFCIGSYEEAFGVMLFYRVGELFEHIATRRSRNQIMEAVDLRPEVVRWVKGDSIRVMPAENADIGDILLIRPGDRVPLDGSIVFGESYMDTSAITGEPMPIPVGVGSAVTSGWINGEGVLHMRVEKYLEDSMVTRILDAVEHAAAAKPQMDRFITRFCRVYTPIVCAIALLTALIPSLLWGNWSHWIYTALSFLVVSCPCALVLSVPLAYFCGIGRGSKQGILFKGGAVLEALGNIKAVALDKTGTVTKGEFSVQEIRPVNGSDADGLLALAAGCEAASTHPIAASIRSAAAARGITPIIPEQVTEQAGVGILAVADGAVVLCGNAKLLAAHGIPIPDHNHSGTQVFIEKDGIYLGQIRIDDRVKPDAAAAVKTLHSQGLTTAMLTGDAPQAARVIADTVGIPHVFAGLLPEEKLRRVEDLRNTHGAVLFVGDGINDAPVLSGADVGAAMGSGADAAIEAADVVFMSSEVSAIPNAIRIARRTNRIAMQNVVLALTIKLGILVLGLLGHANLWTAVFADTGVAMLCIMNSIRILYHK